MLVKGIISNKFDILWVLTVYMRQGNILSITTFLHKSSTKIILGEMSGAKASNSLLELNPGITI